MDNKPNYYTQNCESEKADNECLLSTQYRKFLTPKKRTTGKIFRKEKTSICRRVFATSRGHVAAAARLPATKPAEKLAPNTLAALALSPTNPSSFLLTYKDEKSPFRHQVQWIAE